MNLKTKILTAVSVLMCGLVCLSACGNQAKYGWELANLGNSVNFHTQVQSDYLAESDYTQITKYGSGKEELSRPEPVHFSWTATAKTQSDATVENYVVEISQNSRFTDSITYTAKTNSVDVYNLYIATDYYWRVTAELSDGKKSVSDSAEFTTAGVAPRNIYVDGITNIRDLGGWETSDGGRVKQGMIYRCGRLNVSEQPNVEIEITEEGISTMRDILGIRSEIDLRTPTNHNTETGGITSSPLGEDVTYKNFAMEWNVGNILTNNKDSVKQFFEYLTDEDNYPIIYHCNIGTDRTGLFAFLINGLMGVSEEDLYRDYLFSNLGKINNTRTVDGIKNSYVATVKSYSGLSLSEKIENCLKEYVGLQQSDIDTIKNLLAA